MKKQVIFVASLVVALATVFGFSAGSDSYNSSAIDLSEPTKDIVVTKIWQNDEGYNRPTDLVVTLEKTVSILLNGCQDSSSSRCPNGSTNTLEAKMKSIAGNGSFNNNNNNIKAIVHADKDQYDAIKNSLGANNRVEASGEPTYMWFDSSTGTIYYYSEASTIYLNANSAGLFRRLTALTDIRGLADLNTSYVTDMNRIFQDSTSLAALGPLASWDTSSVTDMTFAFGGSGISSGACTTKMSYSDLSPLSKWKVSSVDSFYQTFKCSVKLDTLKDLKEWDVSGATNVAQMFNYVGKDVVGGTDVGDIKDWPVTAVKNTTSTGSTTGFQGMFNNATTTNRQNFSKRSGSWSGGTYLTNSDAVTPATPTSPGTPTASTLICSGNDWLKSGDTWTCTKTVPNDNSYYRAYEDIDSRDANYDSECGGTTCLSSDPARIKEDFIITNTNKLYKEIDFTKQWAGDSVYAKRPSGLALTIKKNNAAVSPAVVRDWVKNDNTWTRQFIVYDNTLADYTIAEDAVQYYTADNLEVGLTIDSSTGYGSATITNTLNTYDLTYTKKVTGNLADTAQSFSYTVNVYSWDDSSNPVAEFSTAGTWQDGATLTISGIPEGFKYEAKELSNDIYDEYYEIARNNNPVSKTEGLTTGLQTMGESQTVTFTNDREKAVVTGVLHDKTPFALVLSIMIGLGTSFVSFYFTRKFKPKIRGG